MRAIFDSTENSIKTDTMFILSTGFDNKTMNIMVDR